MTQIHNRSHLIRAACPCEMCKGPPTRRTGVAPVMPDDPLVREAHRLICMHGFPVRRAGAIVERELARWLEQHDQNLYTSDKQRADWRRQKIDQGIPSACAVWQRGLKEPVSEPLSESDSQTRDTPLMGSTLPARSGVDAPIELE